MKKLILTTLIATTTFATTAFAAGHKQDKMARLSADDIKARIEKRISQNPDWHLGEFTEKDGKYHYTIVDKDGSLVKEEVLDPKNHPKKDLKDKKKYKDKQKYNKAKTKSTN